jgi:hypothetical protein
MSRSSSIIRCRASSVRLPGTAQKIGERPHLHRKRLTNRTYRFAAEFGKPRTDYNADEVGGLADVFRVYPGGGREFCLVVTVEKPNENIMDSNTDYERYDGLGLAGLVKDGSVSPDELLEAAIERVEQRNPTIKAVVDRMYDQYAKHPDH